jgi:hypothetical protein
MVVFLVVRYFRLFSTKSCTPDHITPNGIFLAAPRSRDNTANVARTPPTQPLYQASR